MEKVSWKVTGMDCTNCALSISTFLTKKGMTDVKVNFIGGDVNFQTLDPSAIPQLEKGIADLGYQVVHPQTSANSTPVKRPPFFRNHGQRFLFCLPFTAVLMLHMFPAHPHFLMNPWIQLLICLPVFVLGMSYFGVSAVKSLLRGFPNMNVLIAIGALAAFVYSLVGTVNGWGMDFVFYETTATIITLVFLGEWLEHQTVERTQKALNDLSKQQKVMANMIAFDDQHQEQIFEVENTQLRVGDLVLIKSGEQVPADCKILWGAAQVDESLLTGESKPVHHRAKEILVGGSLVLDGTVKAQVTATGKDTVLSQMLQLVQQAQAEKPPIQQLADKISAVFVPAVLGISVLSFLINYVVVSVPFTQSLMRSIAVLVISCPCAMGLATPAAIAVGLGRATRKGILFRNARSLELFKSIRTVVFDKTGTLTQGHFSITGFKATGCSEEAFKQIVFSLEKYSNHPIAQTITKEWKTNTPMTWRKVEELKGEGIHAEDAEGNVWRLGNIRLGDALQDPTVYSAYLYRNNDWMGWIQLEDAIREEAQTVVDWLHRKNIKTVLLSGDAVDRCQQVADQLGIKEVYGGQNPAAKLAIIDRLNREGATAMVGDGINDAPALAKATIGISMSAASQLAIQTAQVVLMSKGIREVPLALGLGKHTFITIQENLFWAFLYNIVAIPVAAAGFLHPGWAAMAMGGSDVVLALNSIRLNYKKVDG